jgi:branched-subunit amino acid ABC-type transport system permease component
MGQATIISQLLINGILFGAMYGIAAIGLSVIFGNMRIIFLAHGSVIIFFAYICYWLLTLLGIDPYLSLTIIIPLSLLLGAGLYYGVFKEAAILENKNVSLLLAVGIMYLLENIMLVLWGPNPKTVVTAYTSWVFRPMELNISFTPLIALLLAILAAAAVFLFLKRARAGIAVRAASEDVVSTTLMGINPNWVNAVAFAIGIGLAGVAGVGIGTVYSFDPIFGLTFCLKGLIALALGGIGNIWGALFGGITLGVIESFASFYIGSGWTDAISFGVFLLILVFMPQGLFGSKGAIETAQVGEEVSPASLLKPSIPAGAMKSIRSIYAKYANIIIIALLIIAFATLPFYVDVNTSYLGYYLFMVFIFIIVAQGWNIAAGYCGQISLGTHAFFGLGAYTTFIIWLNNITHTGYYFDPVTMILSGLVPVVFAIIIGTPLLSRLRGDYFSLGTLGAAQIITVVILQLTGITGGAGGLHVPSTIYTSMKPYYWVGLLLAILATALVFFVTRSRLGLALKAIQENEISAASHGVDILKYKVFGFALSAFLAGIGGSLYSYYLLSITPYSVMSLNWLIYPILVCVLGGYGTIIGAIPGAFLVGAIVAFGSAYLKQVHPILAGVLIILVMKFAPGGLMGLKNRIPFLR